MIYLDYNASTPLCKPAKQAMIESLAYCGNPSSIHFAGQQSRQLIEKARHQIAHAIDLGSGDVIFTSGATESINTMFHIPEFETIITSQIDHSASIKSAEVVQKFGKKVSLIPVCPSGIVDLNHLEQALKQASGKILVSILYVNNETGVIQPIPEIIALCRKFGAFFHCDAVQAFGRFPLSFKALDFDYLSLSAHKCGGPKGVGVLIKKQEVPFEAFIKGGGQERSMRAGTQNLSGIVGFGEAASFSVSNLEQYAALVEFQTKIESEILAFCPEAIIHGQEALRVPNTIALMMPNVPSQTQLIKFDMHDIAISGGAACSSGAQKPSHVLAAMGVMDESAACTIRISFGLETQMAEIEYFIQIWKEIFGSFK